jgi:hypothetical protein
MQIISPRGSVKLTFRSACTSSKLIETLRNSIAGVCPGFINESLSFKTGFN